MQKCLQDYRRRNNFTQEQAASVLLTTKPNICNIEKGRRNFSNDILVSGFERCTDPIFLNDMAYELSSGYTAPTSSDSVYDDHRMCHKERTLREIEEVIEVFKMVRLDKHPERCTPDDIANVLMVASEVQDVIFEATALVNKLFIDYNLKPQEEAKRRDQKFKMEQRI